MATAAKISLRGCSNKLTIRRTKSSVVKELLRQDLFIETIKNGFAGPGLKAESDALQERKTALHAQLESADEPPWKPTSFVAGGVQEVRLKPDTTTAPPTAAFK